MPLTTQTKPFFRGLRDAVLIVAVIVAALYANDRIRELPAEEPSSTSSYTAQK